MKEDRERDQFFHFRDLTKNTGRNTSIVEIQVLGFNLIINGAGRQFSESHEVFDG